MFSREKIDKLFSHRFNNHKINILFEKKSAFDFIYEISQNKFKVFKKYLNNNLIEELFRSSYSFVILSFFFIRKFNEDLRFYIKYRVFNAIIIKNRYLLF